MLSGTRKGMKRKTSRRAYKSTPTKRRKRRSKGMLSELFSGATAQASVKQITSGAVGGAGALILEKVLSSDLTESQKGAYQIVAGFLTASMLKKGYVGAGMSAIGISKILEDNNLLGEDMSYSNVDMSQPMFLDEGPYLAEDEYLQENYDVGYYPNGFGGMY